MNGLLAAVLFPLYFTAPADTLDRDAAGRVHLSKYPVHAYVFYQLDANRRLVEVRGYADSLGRAILRPRSPGTRETVWFVPGPNNEPVTIFVLSRDANGNLSAPSNGVVVRHGSPGRSGSSRLGETSRTKPFLQKRSP